MLIPSMSLDVPDTEQRGQRAPHDPTVLGDLERLALALKLTVPSSVLEPRTPPEPLSLLDFRLRVARRSAPSDVKDRAWRYLGERARDERGDWNLFALGVAKPKLGELSLTLGRDKPWQQRKWVHFRLAGDFLLALHRLNLNAPRVFPRLVDTAHTDTTGRKRPPELWMDNIDEVPEKNLPTSPYGIPGLEANPERRLLEELVVRAEAMPGRVRITERQATLVARTYIDGETLRVAADEIGLSESAASKQRDRAEAVIALLLGRPDLIREKKPKKASKPEAEAVE